MSFGKNFPRFNRCSTSSIEPESRAKHSRERGWALISVLWTTAMLAMMAAATQDLTVTSVRTERRALTRAHLDADLNAAMMRAMLALDDSRVDRRWRIDGYPYPFTYDGVNMTIAVQDEDGRFDLNEADGDTLEPLFETVGLDTKTATTLSDRIVEWRTNPQDDDTHTLHGGTDADYAAAGLPWRPRHNDFQTVDELRLVLGMTPALFEKVRPALTVYSRNDSPDPNLAPRLVLIALNTDNPSIADKIMAQRAGVSQALGASKDAPGNAILANDSDLGGQSFEIDIEAFYDGRHVTRRAVVVMTGDSDRPYLVEHWEQK